MSDHIVGMMWNRNEADILRETLSKAVVQVDSLFLADDGSTDGSREIIEDFAASNDKVEYVYTNQRHDPRDQGHRQHLLDQIQKRYKPENTWVQIMESDIMILDTDIREALKQWSRHDLGMSWHVLNAARKTGTWKEADKWPNWEQPISEVMPYGHWMEVMLYTFRPMSKLKFDFNKWRPWPQNFGKYLEPDAKLKGVAKGQQAPLLAHYGFRGPTHYFNKCKSTGKKTHRKYTDWDLSSVQSVEDTVFFFNGVWNGNLIDMSREGWVCSRKR